MSKLSRIDPQSLLGNPRASYTSWLRYHKYILTALQNHPGGSVFPCDHPESLASKLRDAVRGAIAFGYEPEKTETLVHWYAEIIIRPQSRAVYIGPKTAPVTVPLLPGQTLLYSYDSLPDLAILAFATLLNLELIQGPVVIRNYSSNLDFSSFPNVIPKLSDATLTLL